MNALRPPFTIHRIFHPTDFSQDSQVAFAHALKLALVFRAELTIMHVDPAVSPEGFEDFPRIRPTRAAFPPGRRARSSAPHGRGECGHSPRW
ncbi:MAG TPA: universal stress protein, partial [Nitrospira sp.]|nr:universal stress protein [Nitrospira sp.]